MSMPGGYSTESLLPVSGSASSVPIIAMRGGDGSTVSHTSAQQIPIETNSNWNSARELAGQSVKDNIEVSSNVSVVNTASTPTSTQIPGQIPIPIETNSNWNNARELAGKSVSQTIETSDESKPLPTLTSPVKKQGLPIDIFNRTYTIRPKSERTPGSEFTDDEKEALSVWRAEEVFPTREQQHEFLNELLLGCKNDTIIPTDSRCGRVRELLTNLASREWGAYHSTGTIRTGPRAIDRERCEFMFDVTGSCDMSTMLVRDDMIDFFDTDGGDDEIVDIINKPSYSYLDTATDKPVGIPASVTDITLGDIQRTLSSAVLFHLGRIPGSMATQRRIHALQHIIESTLSDIGELAKKDRDAIHRYITDSSAPIPPIFSHLSDDEKGQLRKKIDELRTKLTNDTDNKELIAHVMKVVDDPSTALTKLDDISKKVDDVSQITHIIDDATNEKRELTDEEQSELEMFVRELESEDPDDIAIRRVLGSQKALALWKQYIADGMSPLSAFRTASVIAEMPNVPQTIPGIGSSVGQPTAQEQATRELNEFLASYHTTGEPNAPVIPPLEQMANNSNTSRRNQPPNSPILSDIPMQLSTETPVLEQMANNSNTSRRNQPTNAPILSEVPVQLSTETPVLEQMANNSNTSRRNQPTNAPILSEVPVPENTVDTKRICDMITDANKQSPSNIPISEGALNTKRICDTITEANTHVQKRGENHGRHPLLQELERKLGERTRTDLLRYARDLGISSTNNDNQSLIDKILKKIIVDVTGSSAADSITDNQRDRFIHKVNDILSIQLLPNTNIHRNENITEIANSENDNLEKILANTNTSIIDNAPVKPPPSRRNIEKQAEFTAIQSKIDGLLASLEGQNDMELIEKDKSSINSLIDALESFNMRHTNIGITKESINQYIDTTRSRLIDILGAKAKAAKKRFANLASSRKLGVAPMAIRKTQGGSRKLRVTRKRT